MRDALAVAHQIRFRTLTQGNAVEDFEEKVSNFVDSKYAVAVSSATAGLHIALLALNLQPGDKVVTSPLSFLASSNVILYAGLTPVFVDICPKTKNLDFAMLKNTIENDSKIKAVIPVHYAGLPCEMDKIFELCASKKIKIVEDAAHALGGSYSDGQMIGSNSFSEMTVFSFHPVKSVTTGEGGVVSTNSLEVYTRLCQLRSHGYEKQPTQFLNSLLAYTNHELNPWYREMKILGFHYRLTEIQARLGISQMRKLEKFMEKRRKAAAYYDKLISSEMVFSPAQKMNKNQSGNHLYPIEIDFHKTQVSKSTLMVKLRELGIGTQVHYMPINMNPYYESLGFEPHETPNAMNYYFSTLSIPIFPGITKRQQRWIIESINNILKENEST